MGRKSTYKPEYAVQVKKLCLLGATDDDLADFFGVTDKTIDNWKKKYPAFLRSLKEAKKEADAKVVKSLYQRAIGYDCPDTKFATFEGDITDEREYIKHYAPDVTACIFWLKNRQPAKWRDVKDMNIGGQEGNPIGIIMFGSKRNDTNTKPKVHGRAACNTAKNAKRV